jgi:hypothetical protein
MARVIAHELSQKADVPARMKAAVAFVSVHLPTPMQVTRADAAHVLRMWRAKGLRPRYLWGRGKDGSASYLGVGRDFYLLRGRILRAPSVQSW